jgi:enoyl-CoA hydratase/carnithine racemase
MQKFILRNDVAGVATLTLNRPEKLNALSVPMFRELRDHIDDISAHPLEVKVVVLRGAGKCFSAGHDMGDLSLAWRGPGHARAYCSVHEQIEAVISRQPKEMT